MLAPSPPHRRGGGAKKLTICPPHSAQTYTEPIGKILTGFVAPRDSHVGPGGGAASSAGQGASSLVFRRTSYWPRPRLMVKKPPGGTSKQRYGLVTTCGVSGSAFRPRPRTTGWYLEQRAGHRRYQCVSWGEGDVVLGSSTANTKPGVSPEQRGCEKQHRPGGGYQRDYFAVLPPGKFNTCLARREGPYECLPKNALGTNV